MNTQELRNKVHSLENRLQAIEMKNQIAETKMNLEWFRTFYELAYKQGILDKIVCSNLASSTDVGFYTAMYKAGLRND